MLDGLIGDLGSGHTDIAGLVAAIVSAVAGVIAIVIAIYYGQKTLDQWFGQKPRHTDMDLEHMEQSNNPPQSPEPEVPANPEDNIH